MGLLDLDVFTCMNRLTEQLEQPRPSFQLESPSSCAHFPRVWQIQRWNSCCRERGRYLETKCLRHVLRWRKHKIRKQIKKMGMLGSKKTNQAR